MKGWRTIIFNIVMGAVMFGNQVWNLGADTAEVAGHLNALDGAITGIWALGNMFFRAITTTPLGEKI